MTKSQIVNYGHSVYTRLLAYAKIKMRISRFCCSGMQWKECFIGLVDRPTPINLY
jgi:hypothetical protein